MKKHLVYILLTLVLVSCGTRSGYFKIDGHFLHLNQGEFYVYSLNELTGGLDTIKVEGGRFTFETPCPESGVLVLVFPNFSEQPVFAESGKTVTVKADASHLKELKVEGTETNELMNAFREEIAKASPPEILKAVERFALDHPESPVSTYLITKYYLQSEKPDYQKAIILAEKIIKSQPNNGQALIIKKTAQAQQVSQVGKQVSRFSATDINGNAITSNDFKGKYGVIYTWASWSYESQDMQRRLKRIYPDKSSKLHIVGINLDASKKECRNVLKYDSLKYSTVCDEKVFDSPLLEKLGLRNVPSNIVFDQTGRIIARQLSPTEMSEKLNDLIP